MTGDLEVVGLAPYLMLLLMRVLNLAILAIRDIIAKISTRIPIMY